LIMNTSRYRQAITDTTRTNVYRWRYLMWRMVLPHYNMLLDNMLPAIYHYAMRHTRPLASRQSPIYAYYHTPDQVVVMGVGTYAYVQ
jgi:hypothetical protein